jgi:TPR repeat protein
MIRLFATTCVTLCLAAVIATRIAAASPEVDRLADLAAKGDQAALSALVDIARKNRDADAEYALGVMAYEGRGLERNLNQAFGLVSRAAAKGHADASNTLGFFYEHGVATPVDLAKALASYRRGAEGGSARARTNLGWFYEQGIEVAKDPVAAAEWYKLAADQGLGAAHANLASLYESGLGVAKNPVIAIALYERALEGGVTSAALRLGRLQEERGNLSGAGAYYVIAANAKVPEADLAAGRLLVAAANPKRNIEQGVPWLEQAAARGKIDALLLLASLFDKGGEVARDPRRAADYSRRAALLGDAAAAFRYAQYLATQNRPGPDGDPLPWFRRAAEKGHAEAQYESARLLDLRGGDEETQKEALAWYRKAAAQGHLPAALRLGIALETGRGTAPVPAEAIPWYLKAAEANDPESLFRLGSLYDRGMGAKADFGRARDYYSRAAALGHAEAARMVQRMIGVPILEPISNDPFKGMR